MKSFIWSFLSACWSKMIRNCSVASLLRGTVLNGYKSFLTKTEQTDYTDLIYRKERTKQCRFMTNWWQGD